MKENWNKFIIENGGSFLQSYEWGEFQAGIGRLTIRFSGAGWQTQFIENKLPGVNKFYWYCPRGSVIDKLKIKNEKVKILEEIISRVKETAGKKVIFFRLGPEWPMANGQWLMANGFQQLPYDIEPSQTQILDIAKSEDELLAQMHEKTRYNIRLAERKDVQVKFVTSDVTNFEQYFEEFYRLVSKGTAERKQIKHHPKDYYRKQLEINQQSTANNQQPKFMLFVAEYEKKVIAANILVVFGKTATYLYGATDNNFRNLMAPHLLQWEQIKYVKSLGCAEYDFWGIVNEHTLDKRGKSWEGFTRFKKGFGGREVNYVGYWDYSLDKKWYFLYRLVQKFRR